MTLRPERLIGLLEDVLALCEDASTRIIETRDRTLTVGASGVQYKQDRSPVTEADMASHRVLMKGLPGILQLPVVSEEGPAAPSTQGPFWLIDPLDGTKEFLAGRSEFTVNVALVEAGRVRFGLVAAPAKDLVFAGVPGIGAWRYDGTWQAIRAGHLGPGEPCRVVVSRSHRSGPLGRFNESLVEAGHRVEEVPVGSSLKLCQVANGEATVYPRFGPTMHWDTAAAHAVVEGAGGRMSELDGAPITYLTADRRNPWFIAGASTYRDWTQFLGPQGDDS